jgi:hypothetical protein
MATAVRLAPRGAAGAATGATTAGAADELELLAPEATGATAEDDEGPLLPDEPGTDGTNVGMPDSASSISLPGAINSLSKTSESSSFNMRELKKGKSLIVVHHAFNVPMYNTMSRYTGSHGFHIRRALKKLDHRPSFIFLLVVVSKGHVCINSKVEHKCGSLPMLGPLNFWAAQISWAITFITCKCQNS